MAAQAWEHEEGAGSLQALARMSVRPMTLSTVQKNIQRDTAEH